MLKSSVRRSNFVFVSSEHILDALPIAYRRGFGASEPVKLSNLVVVVENDSLAKDAEIR